MFHPKVMYTDYADHFMDLSKRQELGLRNYGIVLLLHARFEQSQYDPSLFLRHTTNGATILLIYVDDIIISETDLDDIL